MIRWKLIRVGVWLACLVVVEPIRIDRLIHGAAIFTTVEVENLVLELRRLSRLVNYDIKILMSLRFGLKKASTEL